MKEGADDTCPMHQEIEQVGPGSCPIFGMLLSPMLAAAAMSFSSVSVIANALRLTRVKLS